MLLIKYTKMKKDRVKTRWWNFISFLFQKIINWLKFWKTSDRGKYLCAGRPERKNETLKHTRARARLREETHVFSDGTEQLYEGQERFHLRWTDHAMHLAVVHAAGVVVVVVMGVAVVETAVHRRLLLELLEIVVTRHEEFVPGNLTWICSTA